jgi:hypothetical protein
MVGYGKVIGLDGEGQYSERAARSVRPLSRLRAGESHMDFSCIEAE